MATYGLLDRRKLDPPHLPRCVRTRRVLAGGGAARQVAQSVATSDRTVYEHSRPAWMTTAWSASRWRPLGGQSCPRGSQTHAMLTSGPFIMRALSPHEGMACTHCGAKVTAGMEHYVYQELTKAPEALGAYWVPSVVHGRCHDESRRAIASRPNRP